MASSLAPDSSLTPEPERRAVLVYPFEGATALAPGEAFEVAPGVLRLRLPLPFALDHINVWALRDGDGWTVVDTGINGARSIAAWEAALAGPLEGRAVKRVIATHMHPDHIGLAGWFTRRFGCPLLMTRLEYLTCRVLAADTGREAPQAAIDFYRAAGWTPPQIELYRSRFGGFGRGVSALPEAFHSLADGDEIEIGAGVWRVIVGNGHSPEHACLYRESDRVLISGDQVLPRISSNVSVWPTEPLADPLGDWLASLDKLARALAPDTLVLPAHGEPFRGVHDRLSALGRGHAIGLERLLRALETPKRAVDVFGALFARSVADDVLGMATGEALAHLNHLRAKGLAVSEQDADSVAWWRVAA